MSETTHPAGGLTRRGFLKGAGTAAGVLGLAGVASMTATNGWLAPAKANAEPEEKVAYTFHQSHCHGDCHLKCTVRDGRLALIEPNEFADPSHNGICIKGISEIQHVYSTDRIQTPLKRIGERGSGEFVPISWDEAFDIIEEEIKKIWSEYGKEGVFIMQSGESRNVFLPQILGAQLYDVSTGRGIDIGVCNGLLPAIGTVVLQTSDIRDWVNVRTVLSLSNNILESALTISEHFLNAVEAGTRIVTVDPHFSTNASKSSEWLPIVPGTDAALFMGMTNVILENEWQDNDYIATCTTFPCLVDIATGLLIREQNSVDQEIGSMLVVDKGSGQVALLGAEGVVPDLEATVELDGKTCQTVFLTLKQRYASYSPDWAEGVTGIPAAKIIELARALALDGPAVIALGMGGADKYTNADVVGHAAIVLASLIGIVGADDGSGIGFYAAMTQGTGFRLGNWEMPEDFKAAGRVDPTSEDIRDPGNGIHGMVLIGDILQQNFANMNKTIEWANSMDFIVGIDMYHMTSSDYCDIVLPACTKFECSERVNGVKAARDSMMLSEQVIQPLFDSKSDFEIELLFAERFGWTDELPSSMEEYVRRCLEAPGCPTVEELLDNRCLIASDVPSSAYMRAFSDRVFPTKSTKLEVYYESLLDDDQALPTWEPPTEAWRESDSVKSYPLQFTQWRTKFHIHNQFCDATWIRQFIEGPVLFINPIDAAERGLKTGELVETFNDRGSFVCECEVTERVRPGSACIFEGAWSKDTTRGNLQNVTRDAVGNNRGPKLLFGRVIPFNDTMVEVRKA